MIEQKTVVVAYGGQSPEHGVSCISAGSIMEHIDRRRYNVVPIGISREGTWFLEDGDPSKLRIVDRQLPSVKGGEDNQVCLSVSGADRGEIVFTGGSRRGETVAVVDVILPVLHGPFGEDGTIQGLFEISGVSYIGAGVLASAAAMDKEFTKLVLSAAGLPIGRQVVLRQGTDSLSEETKAELGLPVFVKPSRGGSSIGISRVSRWEDLDDAVTLARQHDTKVIIEAAIIGREIECGVLEVAPGEVRASVPAEIHVPNADLVVASSAPDTAGRATGERAVDACAVGDRTVGDGEVSELTFAEDSSDPKQEEQILPDGGFYSFDTKYLDDVVSFDIPAHLSPEDIRKIQSLSEQAFRVFDMRGLARVDFFLTSTGPVINEINTFPGFTSSSMYPRLWLASGMAYDTLVNTLISTELNRDHR